MKSRALFSSCFVPLAEAGRFGGGDFGIGGGLEANFDRRVVVLVPAFLLAFLAPPLVGLVVLVEPPPAFDCRG